MCTVSMRVMHMFATHTHTYTGAAEEHTCLHTVIMCTGSICVVHYMFVTHTHTYTDAAKDHTCVCTDSIRMMHIFVAHTHTYITGAAEE
jgi:hypothetical protein